MKRFKIKRISDNVIMFVQDRDSIEGVKIPKGLGLHLEHTVKDENDNNVIVPATCEITEEEIVESVDLKRQKEYHQKIDPYFQEAVIDYVAGEPTKMLKLIDDYGKIKLKHPKP